MIDDIKTRKFYNYKWPGMFSMHPRIEQLYDLVKDTDHSQLFTIELLLVLKNAGATRTEASVVLYQGFKLDIDEIDSFVLSSNLWTNVILEDVFFETMKYLYYNPNDKNYEADDNHVQISI